MSEIIVVVLMAAVIGIVAIVSSIAISEIIDTWFSFYSFMLSWMLVIVLALGFFILAGSLVYLGAVNIEWLSN